MHYLPPSRANTKIGYSYSKVHDGLAYLIFWNAMRSALTLLKCARGCLSNRVKPAKPA